MQPGQPSRTALAAAVHRAVHQVLESGRIFADPLAVRILGTHAETAIRDAESNPSRRMLRLFIAVRTRFAEDALAAAVARGVRQLVVLGAGLDTYAYRNPFGESLHVFEVDHPVTQAWKRQRLAEAAIPLLPTLTFAPIDFERETLAEGLAAAGFDPAKQAFFTWLGVVPYLTEQAVFSTLQFIARLPGGAQVVFDYGNPPASGLDRDRNAATQEALAARVASVGEAFKSYFETDALHGKLMALGFREVEDLGPALIRERYFANRGDSLPDRGGHIVRATTM
ncbi:MAG TPA: SAM-dependent methyltransferase [Candidatus Dormibacteraeota bacterium]|nr:SAM-dependent methyltransferase [Candidatus Dormibacteraeota bacterium]